MLTKVFDNGHTEVTLQGYICTLNKYRTTSDKSYEINPEFFTLFVINNFFIQTSGNFETDESCFILDMINLRVTVGSVNIDVSYIQHIYRDMLIEDLI